MNFISRYKSSSNRQSTQDGKIYHPSTCDPVNTNLSNENLTDPNRNTCENKSNSINEIENLNETQSENSKLKTNMESTIKNSNYNSTSENIILFQGKKLDKMKNKKRQSRSASSLLRRLFTCGGVVASCSGANSNNRSATNSCRSSRSGNLEIPDIILTHPESEENLAKSNYSLNKPIENKAISMSDPNLPIIKNEEVDDQVVPMDKKMILPIIKLNDDVLNGVNCEEVPDEDYDEENEEENYAEEYSEDDEDSGRLDDENSFQNNVASIIIEEAEEIYLDDTQVFEEEEYSNENNSKTIGELSSATIPSFSFDFHSDDPEKCESTNNLNKTDETNNNETVTDKKQNNMVPKLANQYSKFLTANNILTDRGCLVNIRTGSFNLGCQQSATSSSSLTHDKYLNDEELIDSHEFFNSLQHESHDFKNSASNYSFRNTNSLSNNNNLDNSALNLLVPFLLIQNRRKNSNLVEETISKKVNKNLDESSYDRNNEILENHQQNVLTKTNFNKNISNSNSLSVNNTLSPNSSNEQEQLRRCSHDPNMEKLHKNYIENVKLASGQMFSNNDSNESKNDSQNSLSSKQMKNTFKLLKFNENFMSLDSGERYIKDSHDYDLSSNEDRIDLESEKSDVLNEIFKVDKWLRDNRNNHQTKKELTKKLNNRLPSMTISEDEDSYTSKLDSTNKNQVNFYEDENDDNDGNSTDAKTKYSSETNDSAIDVRSYGYKNNEFLSISTLSKSSSTKSRVNWQSFSKYYHYYFFQSMNTTWSKYQIAAMSLEQLMALRKLALIQFSKLVERQHSTMIRTFRLFSKKNAANEFQRVYDSIDSINVPKPNSSKTKSSQNSNLTGQTLSNPSLSPQTHLKESSILIGNRKVSHQLGAKIGPNLSSEIIYSGKKKRRSIKKLEKAFSTSNDCSYIVNDEASISSNPGEFYESLPVELLEQPCEKEKKELVFGLPLSAIMQLSGQPLPQPILESMRYIRKIAPHEIGVFRKNGNKARINKLREAIDNNEPISFLSSDITVFDVADTLKLYFRELPECLITNKLSDILLSNYSKIRPEERKTTLQQVMLLIPDENRLVLQTLLLFLNDIAKHHKVNQMTRNNLAVIFSPVIFSMNFDCKKKSKNLKYISTTPTHLNLARNIPVQIQDETHPTTCENNQIKEYSDEDKEEVKVSAEPNSEIQTDTVEKSSTSQLDVKQHDLKRNSTSVLDTSQLLIPQNQSRLLSVPNAHLGLVSTSSTTSSSSLSNQQTSIDPNLAQMIKQNSKRKYSNRLNKAASTLVNFGVDFGSSKTSSFFSDSVKDSLETLDYMNKVVQLCVSDMIKYSMDLFTVPVENFEKLKLSVSYGSEPYNLEYFYDLESNKMKRIEFFTNNVQIEKTNWFYFDKFEDVSIYYFKNDYLSQTLFKNVASSSQTSTVNATQSTLNSNSSLTTTTTTTATTTTSVSIQISNPSSSPINSNVLENIQSSFLIPQKNESFNDKLKLWKCCTLIKHQNLTLEKIATRIKDERHLWDDDFKDGKLVEKLDDRTELYRYVISFMPPHPCRDFFEIRHFSFQNLENETLIITSTSVKHQAGNKLVGDIRSNLIISKYVVEKLFSTDTTTTFKITNYIKMDYKGFTLEFYNKTFGYMMARLLYNLKISLLNTK